MFLPLTFLEETNMKFLLALILFVGTAVADPVESYRGTLQVGPDADIGQIHLKKLPLRSITVTDNNAQDNTLTVAELVGGATLHTSVTGGGTVTTDTAANIIAGSSGAGVLTENGQCYTHFYINDGNQTLTFAGGTGVTISDTGNTILTNEAAVLLVCRTAATTVTVHLVSS